MNDVIEFRPSRARLAMAVGIGLFMGLLGVMILMLPTRDPFHAAEEQQVHLLIGGLCLLFCVFFVCLAEAAHKRGLLQLWPEGILYRRLGGELRLPWEAIVGAEVQVFTVKRTSYEVVILDVPEWHRLVTEQPQLKRFQTPNGSPGIPLALFPCSGAEVVNAIQMHVGKQNVTPS